MSRREWRCRNQACRAVLGRITSEGALILGHTSMQWMMQISHGRFDLLCPACGTRRSFRGTYVKSCPSPLDHHAGPQVT